MGYERGQEEEGGGGEGGETLMCWQKWQYLLCLPARHGTTC